MLAPLHRCSLAALVLVLACSGEKRNQSPPAHDIDSPASTPHKGTKAPAAKLDAGTPTARPLPPLPATDIRLVWIHEHELLESETRGSAKVAEALGKKSKLAVDSMTPTDASAKPIRDYFSGKTSSVRLPGPWATAKVILVVEIGKPHPKKDGKFSRGPGGLLAFVPPNAAPVLAMRASAISADYDSPFRWRRILRILTTFVRDYRGGAQ
jgi:hypothetical protein